MEKIPKWILENLCYYDERNPDNILEEDETEETYRNKNFVCNCDNCFYGRTKLAEEIINLYESRN